MTFTFKLERLDGTPAHPPSIKSTVTNWRVGETIPLGRDRTLRVVGIVVSNNDEPSVLVVRTWTKKRLAPSFHKAAAGRQTLVSVYELPVQPSHAVWRPRLPNVSKRAASVRLPRIVPRMDRDAAIVADYEQFGSAEKAAKRNGVSKKTALRVLKRAGVARRNRGLEKAERLRRVQTLEEAEVPRTEMPARLGISQSQLYLDLDELGYPERRPRKHPKPEPRECRTCGKTFTPPDASQVTRGDGNHCSPLCARRSPDSRKWAREGMAYMHAEADQELARLNVAGYLSMRQAAERLRIAESTLHRYRELGYLATEPKQLVSGEWVRPVRKAELERFKCEDWPELRKRTEELWDDAHPPPRSWKRESRQRWIGRRNGGKGTAAGIEAGSQNKGRPPKWSDDPVKQERMAAQLRKLEHLSSRDAAEQVFGDRRLFMRVQRFRAR